MITWTYALAQLAVGYGQQQFYFLWMLASVFTLLGVYTCASAGRSGPVSGLWAAAFWMAIACYPFLEANESNVEVFINACMIWGLALLLRDTGSGSGLLRGMGVGMLFTIASLYKSHAFFMAAGLATVHVLLPPGGKENRRRSLLQVGCGLMVGIISWGALIAVLAWTGALADFWDDVYVFMQYYVGSIGGNIVRGLEPANLLPKNVWRWAPWAILALLGLTLFRWKRPVREEMLLAVYALFVVLMIMMPGKFFRHYYQLWLPWLAVAGAKTLILNQDRVRAKFPLSLNSIAGIITLLLLTFQMGFYSYDAWQWSFMKYGNLFTSSRRIAENIRPLLRPGETLYVWGKETGFYFYTQSRLASGYGWEISPVNEGPIAEKLTRRMLDEVSANSPQLLVVSPFNINWPLPEWFVSRYEPFDENWNFHPFKIYYLRGGALQSRLVALALVSPSG